MKLYKRRDNKRRGDGETNTWAVSFVDMLSLLLCFFIIFFGQAQQESSTIIESIAENFASKSTSGKLDATPGGDGTETRPSEQNQEVDLIESIRGLGIFKLYGRVEIVDKKLVIEMPNVSFFRPGGTRLTKQGKQVLADVINQLGPYRDRIKVQVQGHTDPTPINHSRKFTKASDNWELSVLRATTALRAFIEAGHDASSLSATGHSDQLPSDLAKNHELMRRITLTIEEKR